MDCLECNVTMVHSASNTASCSLATVNMAELPVRPPPVEIRSGDKSLWVGFNALPTFLKSCCLVCGCPWAYYQQYLCMDGHAPHKYCSRFKRVNVRNNNKEQIYIKRWLSLIVFQTFGTQHVNEMALWWLTEKDRTRKEIEIVPPNCSSYPAHQQ